MDKKGKSCMIFNLKTAVLSIFVLFTLFFSNTAFAILYAPGATLNPTCLPTDSNCDVQFSIFSSSPLHGSGTSTDPFTISQASSTADGYLSSTDWITFNNKLSTAILDGYLSTTSAASTYLTQVQAAFTYVSQPWALTTFPTFSNVASNYISTTTAQNTYPTFTYASNTFSTFAYSSSTYMPLASSSIFATSGTLSNYYFASNPAGYISSTTNSLTNYLTYAYASSTFASTTWVTSTFLPISASTSLSYVKTESDPIWMAASSSYINLIYASSTFVNFAYASNTFATISSLGSLNSYLSTTSAAANYISTSTFSSTLFGYLSTTSASINYVSTSTLFSQYPTFTYASSTYYLTSNPAGYISSSTLSNNYVSTSTASSTYLKIATAAAIYQPIGSYLTSFTESDPIWMAASSSYLTTASSTATYLTIANASANYVSTSSASSTYAKLSGAIFTGNISALNFSGTSTGVNTGDESSSTIRTKLGSASSTNAGYLSSADWITFSSGLSTTLANALYVNYTYASSTFPSFAYASSTFASTTYLNNNFPTFTYASSTYLTMESASSSFPTFAYASSSYFLYSSSTEVLNAANFASVYVAGAVTYDSNTLANWNFENNLNDSVGSYNLTATGTGPAFQTDTVKQGTYSQSVSVNSNRATFPTSLMTTLGSASSWTIEGWMYINPGNVNSFLNMGWGDSNGAMNIFYNPGNSAFGLYYANNTSGYTASGLTGWHFISVQWNGTQAKMYVDDSVTAKVTINSSVNVFTAPARNLEVGYDPYYDQFNTGSRIDKMVVSNIARNGTEQIPADTSAYLRPKIGADSKGNLYIQSVNGTSVPSSSQAGISGFFGIGTATPSATLDVYATNPSASDIFGVSSSSLARLFTITSAGNVGIGTSTPSQALTISGNEYLTGALFDSTNASGTSGQILSSTGTSTQWIASSSLPYILLASSTNFALAGSSTQWTTNGTSIYYNTGNIGIGTISPTALFQVVASSTGATSPIVTFTSTSSNSSLFTVLTNGNVGIGATTPLVKFGVYGTVGSTQDIFAVASSSNTKLFVVKSTGQVGIGTTTPATMFDVYGSGNNAIANFASSSNSSVLYIAASGNVGIGTSTPSQALTISGNEYLTGALFDSTNASGTSGQILSSTGTSTQWIASSSLPYLLYSSSTEVLNKAYFAPVFVPGLVTYDSNTVCVYEFDGNKNESIHGGTGYDMTPNGTGGSTAGSNDSFSVPKYGTQAYYSVTGQKWDNVGQNCQSPISGVAQPWSVQWWQWLPTKSATGAGTSQAETFSRGTGTDGGTIRLSILTDNSWNPWGSNEYISLGSVAGGTMGGWSATNYSGTLVANSWNHISVEYDGSRFRIYTNGTLEYTSAAGQANPFAVTSASTTFRTSSIFGDDAGGYFNKGLDRTVISSIARGGVEVVPADTSLYVRPQIGVDTHGNIYIKSVDGTTVASSSQAGVSGFFGIGTATPGATLDVYATNPSSSDIFGVSSSSLARLFTITSAGNVGIGTSTPSTNLQVQGGLRLSGNFFDSTNSGGSTGMVLQSTGSSTIWSTFSYLQDLHGVTKITTEAVPNDGAIRFYNPAAGLNQIPLMTSNTSPSGNVTCSSGSCYAAFDRNLSTLWQTDGTGLPTYIQYQFPVAKNITTYTYQASPTDANWDWVSWQLWGSNSGTTDFSTSTYTLLDTETGINTDDGLVHSFPFSNSNFYVYYKFIISGSHGGAYTNAAEITMTGGSSPLEVMTLKNSMLGIGTSTPATTLSVIGTSTTQGLNISNLSNSLLAVDATGNVIATSTTNLLGNYVTFSYASSTFATGTNNWSANGINIYNNNTGNVGIGTSTPGAKLDIYGTAGTADIFGISSSSNARLFTITSAGNVGIGTSTPDNLLQVLNLIDFNNTAQTTKLGYEAGMNNAVGSMMQNTYVGYLAGFSSSTGSTNVAAFNNAFGYRALGAGTNTTGNRNTANGNSSLYNNVTGSDNTAIGLSSMTYNISGNRNVAIGENAFVNATGSSDTIAIGYKAGQYLNDYSTALKSASSSIYIGTLATGLSNSDNNSIVIGNYAQGIGANSVVLGNNNILTTVLKGNVGIGTTSPSAKLDIYGTAGIADIFGISSSSNARLLTVTSGGSLILGTTTSPYPFQVYISSSVEGHVVTATGAWANTSDERLKKNITTLEVDTLDKLMQLRAVRYDSITDVSSTTASTTGLKIGFIAQELEQIYPEFVDTNSITGYKSVSYAGLVPVLLKGIQEEKNVLGEISTSTEGLTSLLAQVQSENERSAVAFIQDKITSGSKILTDFVAIRITAVRGYFDELFANKVHSKQICLKKNDNSEVCVNGDELQNIMDKTATVLTPENSGFGSGAGDTAGSSTASSTENTASNEESIDLVASSTVATSTEITASSTESVATSTEASASSTESITTSTEASASNEESTDLVASSTETTTTTP